MKSNLDELADEVLKEFGIKDFRCLNCSTEYSAEEQSDCPRCGSGEIELL